MFVESLGNVGLDVVETVRTVKTTGIKKLAKAAGTAAAVQLMDNREEEDSNTSVKLITNNNQ